MNQPRYTYAYFNAARGDPSTCCELLGAGHLPPYTYQQPQLSIVERVSIEFLDRYLYGSQAAGCDLAAAGNVRRLAALTADSLITEARARSVGCDRMAVETRTETIAMPDGGEMQAYLALPESGRGPGLVVGMEIFGVGGYVRRAAERLAELGYVALAPDLYRRTQPGLELGHDEEGLHAAGAAVSQLDFPGAVADTLVALEHLRGLPR